MKYQRQAFKDGKLIHQSVIDANFYDLAALHGNWIGQPQDLITYWNKSQTIPNKTGLTWAYKLLNQKP